MNVALRQAITAEQFLDWEQRQPVKYEFDGFRPVSMTGGTQAHATIQVNLIAALHSRLSGLPCRVVGSELKIAVGRSFRYPDAFIDCTPMALTATVARHPVIVFEILGPSTAGTGCITKNLEYCATPSIQRYVILEQSEIGATVFARASEAWVGSVHGPHTTLDLPEAAIELPIDELYAGLTFDD